MFEMGENTYLAGIVSHVKHLGQTTHAVSETLVHYHCIILIIIFRYNTNYMIERFLNT